MAADRQFTWDPDFPGFGLQTTETGHKSFVYQYRAGTVSRRMKLDGGWFRFEAERAGKPAPALKGTARGDRQARSRGRPRRRRSRSRPAWRNAAGEAADKNTFKAIAEKYLAQDGSRLRSKDQIKAVLERLAYPRIGSKPIDDLKRSDIVRMLDKVETENRAGGGRSDAGPCPQNLQLARLAIGRLQFPDRSRDGSHQAQGAAPAAHPDR